MADDEDDVKSECETETLEILGRTNSEWARLCKEGTTESIVAALDSVGGADREAVESMQVDALLWGARRGVDAVVSLMLDRNTDVNAVDKLGWSALHQAACFSSASVVALLLRSKAVVDILGRDGNTPLMMCCQERCDEEAVGICDLLLQNGAQVEHKNAKGSFPLFLACHSGKAEMVEKLLSFNANVNTVTTKKRKTALSAACRNSRMGDAERVVLVLIAAGASLQGALHTAVRHSSTSVVRILIHAKADVNFREKDGRP
jgi:uncharacterized protein